MEYECQISPFCQMNRGPLGVQEPLCNDCQTPDCSNPIEDKSVSVLGVPTIMRLWVVNNVVRQVVACKGYIGDDDVADRPKDKG